MDFFQHLEDGLGGEYLEVLNFPSGVSGESLGRTSLFTHQTQ
jgi:hypothetical protein